MSLQALQVLAGEPNPTHKNAQKIVDGKGKLVSVMLVKDTKRRESLQRLFRHLEQEVLAVGRKKRLLCQELRAIVDLCLERNNRGPSSSTPKKLKKEASDDDPCSGGTEPCGGSCGRQYHFTLRCCDRDHVLEIGEGESKVLPSVSYVVCGGQMFLEKCSAFSALGRRYVIRCSDYRKADKVLSDAGMEPHRQYLYEERGGSQAAAATEGEKLARNRRTHVSLDAFSSLVRRGFADATRSEELKRALEKVGGELEDLKSKCPNYVAPPGKEADEPLGRGEEKVQPPQSPVEEKDIKKEVEEEDTTREIEEEAPPLPAEPGKDEDICSLVGRTLICRVEKQKLFLHLQGVSDMLSAEDQPHRLRRRGKTLRLDHSFYPPVFKKGCRQFISAECLLMLLEVNRVTTCNALEKEAMVRDLKVLMRSKTETGKHEEEEKQQQLLEQQQQQQQRMDREAVDSEEDPEVAGSGSHEPSSPSAPAQDEEERPLVDVLGEMVPFQVVNDYVYLEKRSVFRVCGVDPATRNFRLMDRLIEASRLCVDDAFLYEGRRRGYVSTAALRALAESGFFAGREVKQKLLLRLSALEEEKESLRTNRVLSLSTGSINYRVHRGRVYLSTVHALCAAGFCPQYLAGSRSKIFYVLCRLLTSRGFNQEACFLRQGKSKYVFISVRALLFLFETEFGPFKDSEKIATVRTELLRALRALGLEGAVSDGSEAPPRSSALNSPARASLKSGQFIDLGGKFPNPRYRMSGDGRMFVHRKTCFESFGLERAIMTGPRGFSPVNEILKRSGLDVDASYLQDKTEKYAFVSLAALITLLESQEPLIVCLENRDRYSEALLGAVQTWAAETLEKRHPGCSASGGVLTVGGGDGDENKKQSIPFRVREGKIFLCRHACYLLAGLHERPAAAEGDYDVIHDPAAPLVNRGLAAADYFIRDGSDPYAYISVAALLVILNLTDGPREATAYNRMLWENLLVAVEAEAPKLKAHIRMVKFRKSLIDALLEKFAISLVGGGRGSVKRSHQDRLEGEERFVKIPETSEDEKAASPQKKQRLSTCSSVSSFGSDSSRSSFHQEESSRDGEDFTSLVAGHAVAEKMAPGEEEDVERLLQSMALPKKPIQRGQSFSPKSGDFNSGGSSSDELSSPSPTEEEECSREHRLSQETFGEVLASLESSAAGGLLEAGEWRVRRADPSLVHLSLESGFGGGACRKMSFLHRDVCAHLKYDLALRPERPPRFRINRLVVPAETVLPLVERAASKGVLNLLFHLLTLRPCFGNFNPELVETVGRGDGESEAFVDRGFVGSSQTGRTFAGTVRSRSCAVLAATRVEDTCKACDELRRLVVNRSVFPMDTGVEGSVESTRGKKSAKPPTSVSHHQKQKSVWQLESSSEDGCVFVCPQVQSLNTSLPHASFLGAAGQASTVVEHRVKISGSADLAASVSLNGRPVRRAFGCSYDRDKQVGPLLEWAASLRLCVGYPDARAVNEGRYLLSNASILQPEIGKFFRHLAVDEDFRAETSECDVAAATPTAEIRGTLRAPTCRVVAAEHSDVCEQCKLLQEPIDFLGLQ